MWRYKPVPETLFTAVAEPHRRQILDLLCAGERSAGAIGAALTLSQPGVSKHLRILREAGLVSVRGDAQRRLYRINPAPFAALDAWLEPYRQFWNDKLDALEDHLNREA
jgi:DNA-binding transcriptional ArsR family regulator